MHIAVSLILLGSGESLFADLDLLALGYQCTEYANTPSATHFVATKNELV